MNKLSQNSHIITQVFIWMLVFITPYGYFLAEGFGVVDSLKFMVPFLPMFFMWMIGFYLSYFLFIPKLYLKKKYLLFFIIVFVVYYLLGYLTGKISQWMFMPDNINLEDVHIKSGTIWIGTMTQVFVNLLLIMTAIAIRVQREQNMAHLQQETEKQSEVSTVQQTTEVATPAVASQNTPNYIFVKCEYKQVRIDLDDIMYISGMKDYVRIRLVSQPLPITALSTLKAIEEKLPDDRFCRVHRSHIVAIDKIESVENNRIKIADQLIPISETYQDRFNGRL